MTDEQPVGFEVLAGGVRRNAPTVEAVPAEPPVVDELEDDVVRRQVVPANAGPVVLPPPPATVPASAEAHPDAGPVPPAPAPAPARRLMEAATSASSTAPAPTALRAQRGWRGALARTGLPIAPGAAERVAREEAAARRALLLDAERVVRQATWTRAVAILVGNKKGGTGKTPLSITLGGIISAIRGGGVGIVEVSDDPGTLGLRAEGTPALGLGEFVRDVDQLTTRGQVVGYTAPQTSFASVIGTAVDRPRPQLTYDAVVSVAAKLDEYFEVRVMDSGNVPSSGAFKGAADTADVLVIPVMLAGDSTLDALGMLEELRTTESGRRLAQTAIAVVMDDGRPQTAAMEEAVRAELEAAGVRTFHRLPYDAHIAGRGEITLDQVNPHAREALTLLAADVIRALTVAAVPQGRRVQTIRAAETVEERSR
ncbi:MinD/ParA family ATP-binding protein [Cellulosimicrobium sp. 22601]|uniref:MinD/ParA family ATP-binding protein n=1 Tax=unclassified Cellulosimicrobium TaxID=2624466 RepID=UPI003F82A621